MVFETIREFLCEQLACDESRVTPDTEKQQEQQKDAELQTWKQAAARNADLGNQRFSYDRNPQFGYTTAAYPM